MMALTPTTMKLSANVQGGRMEWWMAKGNDTARGPGNYPKINVAHSDTGDITFTIINPATAMFAQTDAFGPKAGANNPTDFWDQFTIVSTGPKTLVVHDANANKGGGDYAGGDYYYELHFSGAGAPGTLDPVITNGGCCRQPIGGNNLSFLAIGVVALIVIYVLIVRPMMSRGGPTDIDQV